GLALGLRLALGARVAARLGVGLGVRGARAFAALALLARALAGAVVGVVEARSLEVDRDRVEHPLHRCLAGPAREHGIVGHALHHLEGVALLAAVLVDRHRFRKYSPGCLALSR